MAQDNDWIGKLRGADAEAKRIQKADADQRKNAEKSPQSVILNPNDIHGNYDANRALETTLGGKKRAITNEDLVVFRENINRLKERKKLLANGGITARQVINLADMIVSGKETDLKRANREIFMAMPVAFNNNVVRFITNAGPDSDVKRHHVQVEFITFPLAASGAETDVKQAALKLCREPLRFNCDCKRFRFWFRYIATIGGFNIGKPFGRDEYGYPKIRNPGLAGVACKHILRTMAEIESSMTVTNFLARAIKEAIKNNSAKANLRATQEEAEQQVKQRKQANKIKTTAEREAEAQRAKERKAAADAVKKVNKPKKPPRNPTQQKVLKNNAIDAIKKLGLPPEIEASMIAQINAN